jgi:hypothetical protein
MDLASPVLSSEKVGEYSTGCDSALEGGVQMCTTRM